MSLTEVLPDVRSLSRADKLRLIQFLAQDLVQGEDASPLPTGQSFPVWSPHQAFAAADVLLRALRSEEKQP